MPFFSNFPVTSARVVKDMTYTDVTSCAICTNTVQKQHQNKTKKPQWYRDPPELRHVVRLHRTNEFSGSNIFKYQERACSRDVGKYSPNIFHTYFCLCPS